ncbi:MAG: cold shock domain-containing protein [Anaerolineae bacterium]|nr:cold shock domain-containing protein [Anaerolineae bacterium]
MRQIRIENYRHSMQQRPPANPHRPTTPRCPRHPSVHMVLAGHNPQWNTIRYLCPLCHATGQAPLEVATGIVSAYFPQKGYGFIENGGQRIFFHLSDLNGAFTPYVGQPVTCRVEQNDHGLVGREVQPQ